MTIALRLLGLFISALIPFTLISIVYQKWRPKNKLVFFAVSTLVFAVIFSAIFINFMIAISTPSVKYICVSYEFYEENQSCKIGGQIVQNATLCQGTVKNYQNKVRTEGKICPGELIGMESIQYTDDQIGLFGIKLR